MSSACRSFPALVFASISSFAACSEPETETKPELVDVIPIEEPGGLRGASIVHEVVPTALDGSEETIGCYSWTLDNEQPLYVNAVEFANIGSYHHSNWFVVPDSVYDGPDGSWPCAERGFDQFAAAQAGTVLFAQSTQAWSERMAFANGVVVRIPAHSRIVAEQHLLNLSPEPRETQAWLTLELIHPFDVGSVLSPLQATYFDLNIPARNEIRFRGQCGIGPERVKVHYVLPHFHSTGNYFRLAESADPDEPALMTFEGFDGGPLGKVFDPPAELSSGFSFTCGYDNWYSEPLTWGIGINEMCVVLMLVEAESIVVSTVALTDGLVEIVDGVPIVQGHCSTVGAPKGLAYELPREEEMRTPLYLPPNVSVDEPPVLPTCEDADPSASPAVDPTLDNVKALLFEPWCSFSSCHGDSASAGLTLRTNDLHTVLLEHEVRGPTELPLVAPGDPEGSWLYRSVSRCEPAPGAAHMPLNTPILVEDEVVAVLREWIAAGANP